MFVKCMNPECGKPIAVGDRKYTIPMIIEWGANDLRNEWKGEYVFHSLGCLADWAEDRAAEHDGRVLVEGKP